MKDKFKKPTIKQWKRLYRLAVELKELAPWKWMEETENFGVENPETKEIGFVSVMGLLGEHLSIGVYLGAKGLYGFMDLYSIDRDNPFALFEIPQIQISFENREVLEKEDREIMKKLGLKFRGRQNYPMFRTIKPGFMPWFISSEDAEILIYAIEQTLEIAPRVKENPEILIDESDKTGDVFLVRFAEKTGNKKEWKEEMRKIAPPETEEILINLPMKTLDQIKSFPQQKGFNLEVDLFPTGTPIAEKGKRPYIPKMLMMSDNRSGAIVGFELISPEETLIETIGQLPQHIINSLEKINKRPQEIHVKSDELFDLFKGFNQQINIKVAKKNNLPAVEMAQGEMFKFFGKDGML